MMRDNGCRAIFMRHVLNQKKPTFHQVCLVLLFTTRGVVEHPENDPIISGTLIQSFRHLEHQNPSIISGYISRASWMQNL